MMNSTRAMTLRRRSWAAWAICAAAIHPALALAYQDDAAAPAAPAGDAAEGAAPAALPPPTNPNARLLVESPPKTPEAIVETAALLADFQAGEHGRAILAPLVAAPPDEAGLIKLYEKLGPAPFAKIETESSLQPEGHEFADLVRQAVRARGQDQAYIDGLIGRLSETDRRVRDYVALKLREGGTAVYQPLIAALADPAKADLRANIRQAMVIQGTDIGPAVRAALATDDPELAAQLTWVLRDLRYRPATPDLLGPAVNEATPAVYGDAAKSVITNWLGAVPSKAEALKAILGAAEGQYERIATPGLVDDDGKVVVWSWDAEKKEVVAESLLLDDAYAVRAAQLGREALKLAPDDKKVQLFAAASALDEAMLRGGLDKGTPEAAKTAVENASDETLKEVVAKSMGTRHAPAAMAAVTILADREHKDALVSPDGRLPLLVQAALDPDRRLRIAATEAIFGIDTKGDYVGASLVWEGLSQLIVSRGKPKVLVAHHILQYGQTLAGQLNELGYDADYAFSGKDLFKKAAADADVELIIMSIGVIDPSTLYTLADLRRDPRTGDIPVAIIADPEHMGEAHRIADRDPLAAAVVRPVTPTQLEFMLKPLLERRARPAVVPPAERLEQAKRSMALVAEASREAKPGYDLSRIEPALISVLFTPELYAGACEALSNVKSHDAQLALVDLASLAVQDEEVRKTAADAFNKNVEKFGTLLTATEVYRQYSRYNNSEEADEATQQILASILDAIEKRAKEQAAQNAKGAKEAPTNDKPEES